MLPVTEECCGLVRSLDTFAALLNDLKEKGLLVSATNGIDECVISTNSGRLH